VEPLGTAARTATLRRVFTHHKLLSSGV
jgi:hypothetical protein